MSTSLSCGLVPCLTAVSVLFICQFQFYCVAGLLAHSTQAPYTNSFTGNIIGSRLSEPYSARAAGMEDGGSAVSHRAGKKNIIVLGGDGFCGWPSSLYLRDHGALLLNTENDHPKFLLQDMTLRLLTTSAGGKLMKRSDVTP
jgi:hypothetical protein